MKQYCIGGIIGFVLGGVAGMLVMHTAESITQPEVVELERSVTGKTADLSEQIRRLEAKVEAHYVQQQQRQKEVRFKTEKLELAKQTHDAQLVTAQEGADHIRHMANGLGITKMVVK